MAYERERDSSMAELLSGIVGDAQELEVARDEAVARHREQHARLAQQQHEEHARDPDDRNVRLRIFGYYNIARRY